MAPILSEEYLRGVVEASPNGIVIVNREGRIILANSQTEEYFGYSQEEVLGQPVEILMPQQFRTIHVQERQRYVDNPVARPMGMGRDLFGQHKDGRQFPVEVGLSPLDAEKGPVLVTIVDITERKQAETSLKESEAQFRTLIETLPDGAFIIQNGNIVYMNPTGLRLLGYDSVSELRGMSLYHLFEKNYHRSIKKLLAHSEDLPPPLQETRLIPHNQGKPVDVEITFINTKYQENSALLGVVHDIRDKKILRKAAQRRERLSILGEFSASIAHELRNPLSSLRLNYKFLTKRLPIPVEFQEAWKDLEQNMHRIEHLVEDVLEFAGTTSHVQERVEIHGVLDSSIKNVREMLKGTGVTVRRNYRAEHTVVLVDVNQIRQVFVNLFSNAIDAMPDGGNLNIKTRSHHESIEVQVIDSGEGISSKHLEKIFEPFFSRKRDGTGLGLAIVSRILEQNNVKYTVKSELGKGTKFILEFPL